MGIIELFLIFFAIVLLVLIVKVVGKLVKFALTIVLILLVILGIFVFVAAADYRIIKDTYQNSSSLFVFEKNGTLTAAYKAVGFGLVDSDVVSKAELIELKREYDESDYEGMLDEYDRLFLVDELGYNISRSDIVELLDENSLKGVSLGVKDGYIWVHPNSAYFRSLRHIPRFVISLRLFSG